MARKVAAISGAKAKPTRARSPKSAGPATVSGQEKTSRSAKTSGKAKALAVAPEAIRSEATAPPPPKAKRAPRKSTAGPETLAELGLERLIRLVLAETERNPAFKKLVTAAVVSLQGPAAVAALIDRRLAALERAEGYIDWMKQRAFAADLDAMLTTVVNELAPLDPEAALDRLIRFLGGSGDVLGRADDSSGRIHGVYERAADAAAALIVDLTGREAATMSLRLVAQLEADGFGLVERLLLDLIPRLPEAALAPLDAALTSATPERVYDESGERDWLVEAIRNRLLRMRQALTDRIGDVDAFIALEIERSPLALDFLGMAERLLAAGRAADAHKWLRLSRSCGVYLATREDHLFGRSAFPPSERERTALEVRILDALGETETAQDLRWREFEATLDRDMLRAYLAKLPDFEDDAALDRAFAVAEAHENPYAALDFFTHWPDQARAARLVAAHRGTWTGAYYQVLVPAAEALEHGHPLAATELYRLQIDDILERNRTAAYGHAARHLTTLDHLADRIAPGSIVPDHEAYREGLHRRHGRKTAFWTQVRG